MKVDRSILASNDQSMGMIADPDKLESSITHLANVIDTNDDKKLDKTGNLEGTWQGYQPLVLANGVVQQMAQMKKITKDDGGPTIEPKDGEDLLALLVAKGIGFHTFYAPSTVLNVPGAKSYRGIAFFTSNSYGFVWCTDYSNNLFTNYINGANGWTGWKQLAQV